MTEEVFLFLKGTATAKSSGEGSSNFSFQERKLRAPVTLAQKVQTL